jgi:hypothetical protein
MQYPDILFSQNYSVCNKYSTHYTISILFNIDITKPTETICIWRIPFQISEELSICYRINKSELKGKLQAIIAQVKRTFKKAYIRLRKPCESKDVKFFQKIVIHR